MNRLRTTAILLAIAIVALAVVLGALVASSQPEPVEDADLIAVGNITMTQVEGEVVAIGDSSVTVRADGEDVEIGCLTRSALWQKDRVAVGDRVFVSYHVGDDGAASLHVIDVRSGRRDASDEAVSEDEVQLPVTSARSDAALPSGSPEGLSGGSSTHNWPLRGSVVKVILDGSCVVMAADTEGAGVLEPGLVTVVIDRSRATLPPISEIEVGCSYEVRYMLPLLEPGYVVADAIEPL